MLNELQRRVAGLMSGLPAADDFALAGGAALIVYGLVDRSTRDLDYFATGSDAVAGLVPHWRRLCCATDSRSSDVVTHQGSCGWRSPTRHNRASWWTWLTTRGCSLPRPASWDPPLHPAELAADTMLALYGRAEGRDFHDVAALAHRYPTERLLELAAAKDRGFDRRRFIEMLASIQRLRAADFPDPQRADELRVWFEQWQRELTRSLQHPGRER